jgi:hypothetical protein
MIETPAPKYVMTWKVNGETTSVLENVTVDQAWENGVPPEALRPEPFNRWHVMLKYALRARAATMLEGETIKFCYQEPASDPEYDVEEVFLTRI